MTHHTHRSTHSVYLQFVVFLCAVSASLSLFQNLIDDQNIVGDPTFFYLDVPHARHRRQSSENTTGGKRATTTVAAATPTNGTQVTEATPPGEAENATAIPGNDATTATARATTTQARVATPNVTGPTAGGVRWADHNETHEDDHDYYKVKYYPSGADPERFWVDIESLIDSGKSPAEIQSDHAITKIIRQAKEVPLKFPFEFYGHDISKLWLTTGGFLYVGTYRHRYMAATQYIAPLMANFDPSMTANSSILYADNGTAFTAEWKNVALADSAKDGEFTFQTTLFNDGRIVFAYKQVPVAVKDINTTAHPVRIGLADAYYNDTFLSPLLKKRSIYQYHTVEVDATKVTSNVAIEMTPNPTCHDLTDCHSCAASNISFNCSWCPAQKRCSSGFDRFRQSWVQSGCDVSNITIEADCNRPHVFDVTPTKEASRPPKPTSRPRNKPTKSTPPPPIPVSCSDDTCNHNGACQGMDEDSGMPVCGCRYPWIGTLCDVWKPDEDEDVPYIPHEPRKSEPQSKTSGGSSFSYGGVVFIIIIIIIIAVLLGWVVYAYRRPTSNSGIFLIELRNKFRIKGSAETNIKYKYHKPENDDSVEHV